jgi:antibiotic biosynthesis monooxygenase (ABM) superfamily enzyme
VNHELFTGDLAGAEMYGAEEYGGEMYDEAMEGDEGFFAEEEQPAEEEKHPLRDALFILVALYIICCIAPLFVGLFAPLRVFFWLEVAGWIIILSWLIFGVRTPFLVWLKERKKKGRQEYASESLVKEFSDEF